MAKKTDKQIEESNDAISGYLKYIWIEDATQTWNRTHVYVTYILRGEEMQEELEIGIGEGYYQGEVEIYGSVKINEDTVDHLKFKSSSHSFKFDGTNLEIWGQSKSGKYKVMFGEHSNIMTKHW